MAHREGVEAGAEDHVLVDARLDSGQHDVLGEEQATHADTGHRPSRACSTGTRRDPLAPQRFALVVGQQVHRPVVDERGRVEMEGLQARASGRRPRRSTSCRASSWRARIGEARRLERQRSRTVHVVVPRRDDPLREQSAATQYRRRLEMARPLRCGDIAERVVTAECGTRRRHRPLCACTCRCTGASRGLPDRRGGGAVSIRSAGDVVDVADHADPTRRRRSTWRRWCRARSASRSPLGDLR